MSMASTSVSKTESPGSNPCAPANNFSGEGFGVMLISVLLEHKGVKRV